MRLSCSPPHSALFPTTTVRFCSRTLERQWKEPSVEASPSTKAKQGAQAPPFPRTPPRPPCDSHFPQTFPLRLFLSLISPGAIAPAEVENSGPGTLNAAALVAVAPDYVWVDGRGNLTHGDTKVNTARKMSTIPRMHDTNAWTREQLQDHSATMWSRVNPGLMKEYMGVPLSTQRDHFPDHGTDDHKDWTQVRRAYRWGWAVGASRLARGAGGGEGRGGERRGRAGRGRTW